MDLREYQPLAMRTSPDGHDRILNGCLGLIGESGEIVDAVKKWKFQSGDNAALPVDKLIDECGDVLWYCAELATGLGESLYNLCKQFGDNFYADLHERNAASPLTLLAVRLVDAAMRPYSVLCDAPNEIPKRWLIDRAKSSIVIVTAMVNEILDQYCGSILNDAMERNIEKLRKRYPDGFDPERSLHRAE